MKLAWAANTVYNFLDVAVSTEINNMSLIGMDLGRPIPPIIRLFCFSILEYLYQYMRQEKSRVTSTINHYTFYVRRFALLLDTY